MLDGKLLFTYANLTGIHMEGIERALASGSTWQNQTNEHIHTEHDY